jgi:hypothetical protein
MGHHRMGHHRIGHGASSHWAKQLIPNPQSKILASKIRASKVPIKQILPVETGSYTDKARLRGLLFFQRFSSCQMWGPDAGVAGA